MATSINNSNIPHLDVRSIWSKLCFLQNESMVAKSASAFIPFLRSCTEETDLPIEGKVQGEIPKWLKGSLIRIGSGLMKVGPDRYNHVFDGLAMMHRFSFQNGEVTYQNKFLRSDAYRQNMKANRIVVSEFSTPAVPDPCKTIFQRLQSLFNVELTDNDLVNIVMYSDEAYACSETNCIWKIDPVTLDSIEKVKFSDFVPVDAAIAHAHEETDGTVYNVGSTHTLYPVFKILKFPPKENKDESPFQKASVICSIPASKRFNASYIHSFAMTENYIIFVEQPLYLSIPKVVKVHFFGGGSYSEGLHWDESRQAIFHVIRKSDGKLLKTQYVAKAFFHFHHINAYEEDSHLIIDVCTYEKGEIIKTLYVKALERMFENLQNNESTESLWDEFGARASRYVLPLEVDGAEKDKNLIKLLSTKATAVAQKDGSILCTPETLIDSWAPELPRINYQKFNGKKYKFFYAIGETDKIKRCLIKGDVVNKTPTYWSESGAVPSEPVFIPNPNSLSEEEDSGVVLASLLYTDDKNKVSLLVLDAKTMKEVGRVTFMTKSSVPADFHGIFIPN